MTQVAQATRTGAELQRPQERPPSSTTPHPDFLSQPRRILRMCISPESPLFDVSMQKLVDCGLAIARGETEPMLFLEYAEALWNVRDLQATIVAVDRAISGTPRLPDHELTRAYASRA